MPNKEYYEKNKEKYYEENKEYRKKNKDKIKEKAKEYIKTEAGKKTNRISKWKIRGIKSDDYNSLYEYYINVENCEECDVELVEGNIINGRCLDHDHETGLFRNVLCRSCNIKRK
jgi:hypothetical protein